MIDIHQTHAEVFRGLSTATTLKAFVQALKNTADRYDDLVTTSFPVHHVDPPTVGGALLYAEDGWEGTFEVVVRAALADAFTDPELLTLVVWTRNEKPDERKAAPYIKHVGQAGDDVLHTNLDKIEVIRFYDGATVDLNDIVAVSF
jgi:hypothetical protein